MTKNDFNTIILIVITLIIVEGFLSELLKDLTCFYARSAAKDCQKHPEQIQKHEKATTVYFCNSN